MRKRIVDNLLWFVGSLVVAVIVWFVAAIEADPVDLRSFRNVPVNVLVDDGIIITEQTRQTVTVVVRAQQSVLSILELDDITVQVDLSGEPAGEYQRTPNVDISRPASADTQPARISITTEREVARQVPVEVDVVAPPVSFATETPERDIFQAEVSGAAQAVNNVSRVVANIDLSGQQAAETVEQTITLVALNAEGTPVQGVTIDPATMVVSVDVTQREDISTLAIRPDILFTTLPDGFEFAGVDYEPASVIINGPPEILAELGDTIDTEPISLDGQTSDFTVSVGLDLPEDEGLIILSETSSIEVEIAISEENSTLPVENITVNIIGLPEDATLSATVNPLTLSVVLNGPASVIDELTADDVQAIVDVSSLVPGTYTLTPQISISQGQVTLPASDITLLPSSVTVTVSQPEATPETTPEAEATAEP